MPKYEDIFLLPCNESASLEKIRSGLALLGLDQVLDIVLFAWQEDEDDDRNFTTFPTTLALFRHYLMLCFTGAQLSPEPGLECSLERDRAELRASTRIDADRAVTIAAACDEIAEKLVILRIFEDRNTLEEKTQTTPSPGTKVAADWGLTFADFLGSLEALVGTLVNARDFFTNQQLVEGVHFTRATEIG